MEVHHHTHHPKRWKEYFWEFFMLFLAVFMGFLAEIQVEHYIEKQREKQFMITMLEDIASDSVLLGECETNWKAINAGLDSVTDALKAPFRQSDVLKIYRHVNGGLNYYGFTYNERTIAQLKNAGGFRLIKDKEVANQITLYDQFNQDAMKKIDVQHNLIYMQALALRNRVLHQSIINQIFKKFEVRPVPYSENYFIDSLLQLQKLPLPEDEFEMNVFEFKNALLALRQDYSNLQWGYDREREKMRALESIIRQKYGL
jgi:hypothetical protein